MGRNTDTTLYSDTTKRENFSDVTKTTNNVKTTKRSHAYVSAYTVDILNSFNPELELKNTEPANKK